MILSDFDNTAVGTELGDIGRLRQIAAKFCPEEIREEVKPIVPDGIDELNLSDLEKGFLDLINGGSGFPSVDYSSAWNDQQQVPDDTDTILATKTNWTNSI